MIRCEFHKCQWPECDKTCGMAPPGDYAVGSCAEESLIYHLQDEITKRDDEIEYYQNELEKISSHLHKINSILKSITDPQRNDEYTCPYGYIDCIYDPAYIRRVYPNWWKRSGMPIKCDNRCMNGNMYDCEDK